MATRTIEIDGELIGPIWWPVGMTCFKPVRGTMTDNGRIDGENLWDLACRLTNDGDFQSARFSPNSVLVVTWQDGRYTHSKVTPLDALPALSELCTEDLPEYGEYDEDDD